MRKMFTPRQVCNINGKGFCCNVCQDPEETCKDLSDCPLILEKLATIKSGKMKFSDAVELYNDVNSKLCSANIKRVCC